MRDENFDILWLVDYNNEFFFFFWFCIIWRVVAFEEKNFNYNKSEDFDYVGKIWNIVKEEL